MQKIEETKVQEVPLVKPIVGGPYQLYKLEGPAQNLYRSVISLCILDTNEVSERFHSQGEMKNQFERPQKNFNEALSYLLQRIDWLVKERQYTLVNSEDEKNLEKLVEKTVPIISKPLKIVNKFEFVPGQFAAQEKNNKHKIDLVQLKKKKFAAPVKASTSKFDFYDQLERVEFKKASQGMVMYGSETKKRAGNICRQSLRISRK